MDVKSIVVEYLKANKYDGLCLPNGCSCLLEDFVPCGAISGKCRPGHRVNVSAGAPCWCDEIGADHWHIVPDVAFGVVNEEEAKQWVCECGAVCDPWSADWRWNGMDWEHHHGYPIGHVIATKMTVKES